MPNFTINAETSEPPINITIARGGGGHVSIKANGITIAFLNARTGKLDLMPVDSHEQTRLAGLLFDNHRFIEVNR